MTSEHGSQHFLPHAMHLVRSVYFVINTMVIGKATFIAREALLHIFVVLQLLLGYFSSPKYLLFFTGLALRDLGNSSVVCVPLSIR